MQFSLQSLGFTRARSWRGETPSWHTHPEEESDLNLRCRYISLTLMGFLLFISMHNHVRVCVRNDIKTETMNNSRSGV